MTESKTRPGTLSGTQEDYPGVPSATPKSRRSGRIKQDIPILLIGSDAEGKVFTEETRTVVLSLHGAGIVTRYKLMPEQEVILRILGTNRETEARVVGQIAEEEEMHTYGVAFLDERLNFWEMEFPPAAAWDDRPPVLTLECAKCKNLVELLNGDFEYDICQIHGGLARYCDECGMVTVWKQSHDVLDFRPRKRVEARKTAGGVYSGVMPGAGVEVERRPAQDAVESVILPIAVPARREEIERRERARAKVSFFACVRSEDFGEEIVACIDMSRGGVSFRSKNEYREGAKIQIAVPYSPEVREAPAIFVKGRIANVSVLAGGGKYRCGVEFLR